MRASACQHQAWNPRKSTRRETVLQGL